MAKKKDPLDFASAGAEKVYKEYVQPAQKKQPTKKKPSGGKSPRKNQGNRSDRTPKRNTSPVSSKTRQTRASNQRVSSYNTKTSNQDRQKRQSEINRSQKKSYLRDVRNATGNKSYYSVSDKLKSGYQGSWAKKDTPQRVGVQTSDLKDKSQSQQASEIWKRIDRKRDENTGKKIMEQSGIQPQVQKPETVSEKLGLMRANGQSWASLPKSSRTDNGQDDATMQHQINLSIMDDLNQSIRTKMQREYGDEYDLSTYEPISYHADTGEYTLNYTGRASYDSTTGTWTYSGGKKLSQVNVSGAKSPVLNDQISMEAPGAAPDTLSQDAVQQDFLTENPQYLPDAVESRKKKAEQDTYEQMYEDAYGKKWDDKTWLGKKLYKAKAGVESGLYNANQAIMQGVDFILPTEAIFGEDNVFDRWLNDTYGNDSETAQQFANQYNLAASESGAAGKLGLRLTSLIVENIPQAVVAIASSGLSEATASASALTSSAAGAAGTEATVRGMLNTVQETMKNPSFWASFAQIVGPSYYSARESGASELDASAYALATAFAQSAVEMGGGLETMNTEGAVQSLRDVFRRTLSTAWEEGGEEVQQDMIDQLLQLGYDQSKPLYSTSDDNAIVNPVRAAENFAAGAAVGGIMGGAGHALNYAANRATGASGAPEQVVPASAQPTETAEQTQQETADAQEDAQSKTIRAAKETAAQRASEAAAAASRRVTDGARTDAAGETQNAALSGMGEAGTEAYVNSGMRNASAAEKSAAASAYAIGAEIGAGNEKIAEQVSPGLDAQTRSAMYQAGVRDSATFTGSAYADIAEEQFDAEGAKAFRENIRSAKDLDDYFEGFARYYNAGLTGSGITINSSYADYVSSDVASAAYRAGLADADNTAAIQQAAITEGRVNVYRDGGLVYDANAEVLDAETQTHLDSLGKMTGTAVKIVPTIDGGTKNGMYLNGVIYIAKDADGAEENISFAARAHTAHELTHRMQELAPQEYRRFRSAAMRVLSEKATEKSGRQQTADLTEALIFTQQQRAERCGIRLTRRQAMDEIAADYAAELMTDPDTIRQFIAIRPKTAQTVWEKLKQVISDLRRKITGKTREEKKFLEQLSETERLWLEALAAASDRAKGNTRKTANRTGAKSTRHDTTESLNRKSRQYIDGEKKYSAKKKAAGGRLDTQDEITKRYHETVEKILSGDRGTKGAVLMGYSPEILEKLGIPNLPLVIGSGHIYSIAKTEEQAKAEGRFRKKTNYHGMGTDFVKNLYSYLHNPVMVIASKDVGNRFPVRSMESVVAIVDIGYSDKSLLVPVEITTERTVDGQGLDVHVLSSAYAKNVYGLIKEAIAQENTGQIGIFYLDTKNETASKVAERVQFPDQPTKATASGIILHSIPEKVNLKIQNQTQTQQFIRWFGDWQNEPTDASKTVNADGTPKVVYYDAVNSGSGVYRLTDSEAGEPVYLNMRRPYRISQQPNPQAEKEIIRRAKQKGYDGVVIAGQDKRYLAFAQTQIKSATDNVGTFDRKSADIRYSIKKNGTKKAADDGSLYDYKKSFAEQIDDWKAGKIPKRDSLLIGGTPEVLQKIGFNALPMTINQTHVDYAINGTKNEDHTIGEDGLRQLPEALQHPVAVIASETKSGTSVVALLPFTHNGNTVIAPVVIDGFARQNNILLDSNAVTSVHGRKNAVTGLLANALNRYANGETTLFYWDKEKATALLRLARVTMPKADVQIHDGYIASIRDADSPVKPKLANITESVQFKRWFGNWKENPNKSSKIVSPDGTPKVVYYDAANSGNGLYRLTDSEAGEPVYLNMRRPYRISQQPNPQAEEEIIRRAKQKGYDGVVIAGQDKRYLVFAQTQIKSATDNVGTFDRNNPNIRYSMKTVGENDSRRSGKTRTGEQAFAEDKYFKRQVDRWDELSDGTRIKVGVVQKDSALNRVGIPAERMFFDVSKIKKTLTKHGSQLSISDLKKIPELLSDPIAITEYEGARNTVNVYGNLFSANGTPIVVGVVMRVDIDGSTMISNIRTVHPRSNYAKQITDETILYLNEDKKRTRNWFHVCGNLRVPLDGTKFGFIRSISFDDGNVNSRASLKSDRSLLDDAVEKYGAIEPGETPAREVNFPQQVNDETRVRRFVRTAAETPQANEAQVSGLERAVIHDAQASYTPVSNAESLKKARAVIDSIGIDAATRQFDGIVESDRMPSAADVALGEQLIHDAMQRGDVTAATHLVEKVAYIGTKAGQAVQAMRLLKQLGGASQLRYTETAVRDVQRQLVRKYGSRAPKIEVPSGLQERLLKAQSEQERADAMDDIMQNIADQMPVTLEDKWNAWRYLAMLGNLRTHIRNMVGNAVFVPAVTYKNIIGAVSESVADRAARMTGRTDGIERTKSLRATIPTQKTRNARTFARNDYKLQKDVVAGGGKYNPTDQVREKQKIFRNRALEWARTRNDKALETEDRLFQRVHYTNALASYMVANNLTPEDMTTPDGHETAHLARARRYATAEAQRATYRDASKLATNLNELSAQHKVAHLIIEGLVPFKKTPVNIVKRAVEYSPIGLLDTATRGARDLRRGSITASQYIDRLSAGMVGSQIVALGVWAAASGIVRASGSGDDDRDGYDEYTLGYQDYAIQIGDNSYTIDWMAPAVMPFMTGAELYRMEQLEQGDGISVATLLDSLSLISEPLVSLSMMDGLQNTLTQIAQSDNKIASIATSATGQYVSQAVPTFVGQLARIGQRNAKTTYIDPDSWIPTFAQKILYKSRNKIPAIPQPVIDAAPDSMATLLKWYNSHCTIAAGTDLLDSWGRATSNGSVPYRVFANMVSPGYYSRIQKTSTDEELLRLYDKTGNAALLPGLPDKRLSLANGTAIVLSADQYTQLKREIGVNSYNLLTKMISSAAYKSAADEDKMALIRDCYDYVRELAKCNLNENVTKTSWIWKINASGIDPATAIAIRYNLQQIEQQAQADGTKRTQMQTMQREYIMSTDLSAGQKKQLDEMFISRYQFVYKEANVDYSSSETMQATQMSESAQKRWPAAKSAGWNIDDYQQMYRIVSDRRTGYTKDAKRADAKKAGFSDDQFTYMWDLYYKNRG